MQWGTQWHWVGDSLRVEWSGASLIDPVKVYISIKNYTGHSTRLAYIFTDHENNDLVVDGDPQMFYCATKIEVEVVNGVYSHRVTLGRPGEYPPIDTAACTRVAR